MLPGLAPAGEVLFFREKDPKPLTPSPTSFDGTDAGSGGRSNSLRSDKARRERRASVPMVGQQASEIIPHHTKEKVADMRSTKARSKWGVPCLLKKWAERIPIANPCNRIGYSVTFSAITRISLMGAVSIFSLQAIHK